MQIVSIWPVNRMQKKKLQSNNWVSRATAVTACYWMCTQNRFALSRNFEIVFILLVFIFTNCILHMHTTSAIVKCSCKHGNWVQFCLNTKELHFHFIFLFFSIIFFSLLMTMHWVSKKNLKEKHVNHILRGVKCPLTEFLSVLLSENIP